MSYLQIVLLFSFLGSMYSNSININNTLSDPDYIAYSVIGNASSNFPGSSFLNYALYGITEQRFYYYEFLQNFGEQGDSCPQSTLIIGNDGLLGGICYGYYAIVPVPGSSIQIISNSLFNKYFPNGYTFLKRTAYFSFSGYKGYTYTMVNSSTMCNPCNMSLYSYWDSPLFSYGSLYYFIQDEVSGKVPFYIYIHGYINQINLGGIQKGAMHVAYVYSPGSGSTIYGPNSENLIQFSIDVKNQFHFEGNLNMTINGSLSNYAFNGALRNNTQENNIA